MIDYNFIKLLKIITCMLAGLSIGSFVTLVSYRLPLDKDIIITRSHCISCKHKLNLYDLIPLLSWIIQAGKCRYCQDKISFRYPLIEISTACIVYFIYSKYNLSLYGSLMVLIATCLMIFIVTDFEHYIIPDQIQIALALLGVVYNIYHSNINFSPIISATIACITGIIVRKLVYIIKKQDPLGFGDIKFLAVSGLYLPYQDLPIYFFISGLMGIITAIIWQVIGKGRIFPFGPALAISLFVILIFPKIQGVFDNLIMKLIYSLGIVT